MSHYPERPRLERSYSKGYRPRRDRHFKYDSTIRDTGRGSAKYKTHEFHRPRTGYDPQTFESIRNHCLQTGTLWEDPDFPAEDRSLFYQRQPSVWPDIQWKRPHEICSNPKLFVDGAGRLDTNQGILGDCWLLAAISSLTASERLLHRVVPKDQSFKKYYAGIFRLEIYQFGRWVEVCVDDRLPTHRNKLIYMHSDEKNEFWNALLEKAYAKLNGSYESLTGGLTSEAMTDLTGGIVESMSIDRKTPDDVYDMIYKACKRLCLMACSIDADGRDVESKLANGLIVGHAYSITDVKKIGTMSGPESLVRVMNPWGDEHEWNGAWSDNSREWRGINRESWNVKNDNDGEFWMSFDDFKANFTRLEICYLGPDTLLDNDSENFAEYARRWEGELMEGSWRRFVNAGGCPNFSDSFWTNPQYRITIKESTDPEGFGQVIIGLMQKNRRKLKKYGEENLTIGFMIYKLDDASSGMLGRSFFQTHSSIERSSFINMREVTMRCNLKPGDYVIVPCTFEPNQEADFILRVYTEKKQEMREIDEIVVDDDPNYSDVPEMTEEDEQKVLMSEESFRETAGSDGEIDAYELRELLNRTFTPKFDFKGFSIDLCRSMVAMKDADLSGQIGLREYRNLWKDLIMCQKSFRVLDVKNHGYFMSYEFRTILSKLARAFGCPPGVRISNTTFNVVVRRYCDQEGKVRFDDFVACIIKLKTLFQTFNDLDNDKDGYVSFSMDEFVQMTMYS